MAINNPIEKTVLSNVKVDYAAGSLTVNDPFTQMPLRVGIADLSFLTALQDLLIKESGSKETKEFFYAFGRCWGEEFYETLRMRLGQAKMESIGRPQDYLKDEFIEHLNSHLSYAGIGQFRITEGNKFYIINLKNAVECFIEKPNADHMNTMLCGFFAGLFSRISGKELACAALSKDRTAERNRFALSLPAVVGEIAELLNAGKSEKEVMTAFGNQHLE